MKAKLGVVLAAIALPAISLPVMGEETTIVRYVDDETRRKPMHTVAPEYPHVARRDRIEGKVKVCYEIDRKGRPYRVAVRESTHRVFESAAKSAIRASTYVPLEKGEENVRIKTCRTFRFRLEQVAEETVEEPVR